MIYKKTGRVTAVTAGVIGITLMLGACSSEDKTPVPETSQTETSVESTEETTTTSFPVVHEDIIPAVTYMEYMERRYESSGGELEDQMVYMMPVSEYENSTSGISDPVVSEAAGYYADQGFTVYDQGVDVYSWGGQVIGDEEYAFYNGFFARREVHTGSYEGNDWIDYYTDVRVYRMNETLFDYYLVESHGTANTFYKPRDTFEDDGTVIRYTDSWTGMVIEYNRETGLATTTLEYTDTGFVSGLAGMYSDALRDAAGYYNSQGYYISFFDPEEYHYFDMFYNKPYPFGTGFEVIAWEGNNGVCIAEVFESDEPMFTDIINNGYFGEELSREDDGTVITVEMELIYEWEGETYSNSCTLEFNRDTGLITVTNMNEVCISE